ncbi:MAG: cytochrome c biogenesis protein CcsA [Omnitrophica bacterium]|nr:cytochrome c biogenesis protein CcsA [Candidatus Omnitrophota bacterium]
METCTVGAYVFSFLFYILAHFFPSKTDQPPDNKPKFFSRAALCFLTLGFLGNLYLIIRHFVYTHRLPLTNVSETLLSLTAIIVIIFLILKFSAGNRKKRQLNTIGLSVSLASLLGLLSALWLFKKPLMPLLPALKSKWLAFHVSSCIIAYCFFTISAIAAIIYVVKKDTKLDREAFLNRAYHRLACLGFYFLTIGIILGSIWGKSAWGHWWNWDPKETWALITWLIYAGYIHVRLFGNWPEKKLAWVLILGFLACLFTYFGVNFLLKGLHSYA